jgi:hypothetical protein
VVKHDSNTIAKFADDTTVVGLITDNDETAYREEVRPGSVMPGQQPLPQCEQDTGDDRGLQEKVGRTGPINGAVVESVESFKFPSLTNCPGPNTPSHTRFTTDKTFSPARRLKRFSMGPQILTRFYSCTIKSILYGCIPVWQLLGI